MCSQFKKICLCVVAAVFCFCLCACRSYNDRIWKKVDFASSPAGATVFINGKNCGLTPRTERLSTLGSYRVRFSKPGYFDEDIVLESFKGEDGYSDILDSVELDLVKITPETLAQRERLAQEALRTGGELSAGTPVPSEQDASGESPAGASPAAIEFAKRAKPTDFTDFRLQEKALKRLFMRGEITEKEYHSLHEDLYNAYNENRLLKAPRLGTYEKAL